MGQTLTASASAGTATKVRERLVEALRLDLFGPGPEDGGFAHEVMPRKPSLWYLSGFLVPEEARAPEELQNEEDLDNAPEDPGSDDAGGEERPVARVRLPPSSIGLSCLLRSGTERVRVRLHWGEYRREAAEDAAGGAEDGENEDRAR